MNKEIINKYINRCKLLNAQGEYIINNYDSLNENDIGSYFRLFKKLVDDLKAEKQIYNLIKEKLDNILRRKSYSPTNKLLYKIQLFFLDWYCGIIGNDDELIAFKTSALAMYINDLKLHLQGIIYSLTTLKMRQ